MSRVIAGDRHACRLKRENQRPRGKARTSARSMTSKLGLLLNPLLFYSPILRTRREPRGAKLWTAYFPPPSPPKKIWRGQGRARKEDLAVFFFFFLFFFWDDFKYKLIPCFGLEASMISSTRDRQVSNCCYPMNDPAISKMMEIVFID